jgi:hypothetical protein
MFQQTQLAAQTHLSEGLALKVQSTEKLGKSLIDRGNAQSKLI